MGMTVLPQYLSLKVGAYAVADNCNLMGRSQAITHFNVCVSVPRCNWADPIQAPGSIPVRTYSGTVLFNKGAVERAPLKRARS